MSDLLLAALERLPPQVRRFVVAIGVLLTLAAVMAALTLTASDGAREQQPARRPPASVGQPRTSPHRLAPPVSTTAIFRARGVAERFLAGYLPYAYGRGSALAVTGITSALRRQLLRSRAQLTPVERRRRPRVVSLQTTGTTPTFVVATAVINDGGAAAYRLRFTLRERAGGWVVSAVQEG